MTQATQDYWNTLNTYYHSSGARHAAARGQLLEFAMHGRGKVKALAIAVLASRGIAIQRIGA